MDSVYLRLNNYTQLVLFSYKYGYSHLVICESADLLNILCKQYILAVGEEPSHSLLENIVKIAPRIDDRPFLEAGISLGVESTEFTVLQDANGYAEFLKVYRWLLQKVFELLPDEQRDRCWVELLDELNPLADAFSTLNMPVLPEDLRMEVYGKHVGHCAYCKDVQSVVRFNIYKVDLLGDSTVDNLVLACDTCKLRNLITFYKKKPHNNICTN